MAGSKNNWRDNAHNLRAFLLRCWQEAEPPDGKQPGESLSGRFALIPVDDQSGARGFACLKALCTSLREELKTEALNYQSARKRGNI